MENNKNIQISEKSVQKFARSGYGIYLTKEIKNIGNPNKVYVSVIDGKIIITKEYNIEEIIRPAYIDKNLWNTFIFVISKTKKDKNIETIKSVLEEIIKKWVEDQTEEIWTIFGFLPIYKKKKI